MSQIKVYYPHLKIHYLWILGMVTVCFLEDKNSLETLENTWNTTQVLTAQAL